MLWFSQTEPNADGAVQNTRNQGLLLFRSAKIVQHQYDGLIADNRAFVLEIVVESQSFAGQMLADDCHRQI